MISCVVPNFTVLAIILPPNIMLAIRHTYNFFHLIHMYMLYLMKPPKYQNYNSSPINIVLIVRHSYIFLIFTMHVLAVTHEIVKIFQKDSLFKYTLKFAKNLLEDSLKTAQQCA